MIALVEAPKIFINKSVDICEVDHVSIIIFNLYT